MQNEFKATIDKLIKKDSEELNKNSIKELVKKMKDKDISLLLSLKDGADVINYNDALEIIDFDKKFPGFILFCEPFYEYTTLEKCPYFGCRANKCAIECIVKIKRGE